MSKLAPSQVSLDSLFTRATRLRVLGCGVSEGNAVGGDVLLDAGSEALARVRDALQIVEAEPPFHCMCLGDLALELSVGEARLATLGFHHARSVRYAAWSSDARLVDGGAFVRWLASQGVAGPLRAHEADVALRERAQGDRAVWLQAAPPCFSPLDRYEPRDPPFDFKSTAYQPAEARLRGAYATAEDAVDALLRWYGSGAGGWSGFPSYEVFAECLLERFGLEVAAAVASRAEEPAVLRGAARLFAGWALASHRKHLLRVVPERVWTALRPTVLAMNLPDNLRRFEHNAAVAAEVRRAERAPWSTDGVLTTVGVSSRGALSGLLSDGRTLYSAEGGDLVAFAPGSTAGKTLVHGTDPHFELAGPVLGTILVAHVNAGTISKVLTDTGARITMTSALSRPVNPVLDRGVVAWLSQATAVDPVRGAPYTVHRSSVQRFSPPAVLTLRDTPGTAFSLVCDADCLYWCELEPSSGGYEIWRASLQVEAVPRRLATVGPRSNWFPKLALNHRHLVWANPDERAIYAVEKETSEAPRVLARTRYSPSLVVLDDHDVFALTSDAGSAGEIAEARGEGFFVEHVAWRGGSATVLAKYPGPPWARPAAVLEARGLFFTVHDRVVSLARS